MSATECISRKYLLVFWRLLTYFHFIKTYLLQYNVVFCKHRRRLRFESAVFSAKCITDLNCNHGSVLPTLRILQNYFDNFWITQMQPEVKEVGNTARLFCSLKAYSDPNLNSSFQKNHWPNWNILAKFRFPF